MATDSTDLHGLIRANMCNPWPPFHYSGIIKWSYSRRKFAEVMTTDVPAWNDYLKQLLANTGHPGKLLVEEDIEDLVKN